MRFVWEDAANHGRYGRNAGVPPAQRTANQSFRGSEATEESRKKARRCDGLCCGLFGKTQQTTAATVGMQASRLHKEPPTSHSEGAKRPKNPTKKHGDVTDSVAVCLGIRGKPRTLRSDRRRPTCTKVERGRGRWNYTFSAPPPASSPSTLLVSSTNSSTDSSSGRRVISSPARSGEPTGTI